jgi:hypothetical protein
MMDFATTFGVVTLLFAMIYKILETAHALSRPKTPSRSPLKDVPNKGCSL